MCESSNNPALRPAHITKQDCESIIAQKYPEDAYTVLDYQLSSVDEKSGFLGEHCRLTITVRSVANRQTQEVHCFAKFMPNTVTQRAFVETTGAFRKEVFFYEVLLPKIKRAGVDYLTACVPQCYLVKPGYVLVFDDVTRRSFKPLSKYQCLDYDHVLVTLTSMAKLHASSLIVEEKISREFGKPYRFLDEYADNFYETFFLDKPNHKGGEGVFASMKGLQTEVDLFPAHNSSITNGQFKQWIAEKACVDNFEMVKPSSKFRNVLCHGDLWCTNFLVQYQDGRPVECVFVDFQTVRYAPPSHDFMTFLHLTTTREFRQRHLHELQRIYYRQLEALLSQHGLHLPAILAYEEFSVSCQEQRRFAVILAATYVTLTQIKDEFFLEFARDDVKLNEALYQDRSSMIKENFKRDPAYRHVLGETMKELRAVCEEQLRQ